MTQRLLISIVICVGLIWPLASDAMPTNSRQIPEGYWVGGRPEAWDVDDLYEAGIRVILSAVVLEQDTRTACRRRGIQRVNVWFGNNFPDAIEILDGLAGFEPHQIFIHCTHGGDRAGALLAFMLVAQQGWRPDHALLAVAFPSGRDVDGLVRLLEESGFLITQEERTLYTGIYSGVTMGGTGGLKIRGPDYRNLVRTMLQECESIGVLVEDPVEPPEPLHTIPVLPGEEGGAVETVQTSAVIDANL